MSSQVCYNVPLALASSYPDAKLVLRLGRPEAAARARLACLDCRNVNYVQFSAAGWEIDNLPSGVPLDLVLREPERDYPLLYRFASLTARQPMRITIPVSSGFVKAVKLAAALNFAVKLDIGQPSDDLIGELAQILDFYLRHPAVTRPIEFFHSLLFAFFNAEPVTLWQIQEEDPEYFRWVTEQGRVTLVGRFADLPSDVKLAANEQCRDCEFAPRCRGYFKWPERQYSCAGIKEILRHIEKAARELKTDYQSYPRP